MYKGEHDCATVQRSEDNSMELFFLLTFTLAVVFESGPQASAAGAFTCWAWLLNFGVCEFH